MVVIALVSTKGGAGKSTLGVNLGAAAVAGRKKTLLIDLDPQRSVSEWAQLRPLTHPEVKAGEAAHLGAMIDAARDNGAEVIIVDTQGHAGESASQAIKYADVVVIPAKVSVYDVLSMRKTLDLLDEQNARDKAVCVLSGVPSRGGEETDARAALMSIGFTVLKQKVRDFKVYRTSLARGSTAIEDQKNGEAGKEIRALWSAIYGRVK